MPEPGVRTTAHIETHDAVVHRGHPQASARIFGNVTHILRRQASGCATASDQPKPSTNPQLLSVILEQRRHVWTRSHRRIGSHRHCTTDASLSIDREQANACPDEQSPEVILENTRDDRWRCRARTCITARCCVQHCRTRDRTGRVRHESIQRRLIATHTGDRHYPQRATSILVQPVDHADRQRVRRVVCNVVAEVMAVVPTHTARRRHPHEARLVLQNVADERTRQSIIDAQMTELHSLRVCRDRRQQSDQHAGTDTNAMPHDAASRRRRRTTGRAGEMRSQHLNKSRMPVSGFYTPGRT